MASADFVETGQHLPYESTVPGSSNLLDETEEEANGSYSICFLFHFSLPWPSPSYFGLRDIYGIFTVCQYYAVCAISIVSPVREVSIILIL